MLLERKKSKILAFLLAVFVAFSYMPNLSYADTGGTSTEDNTFEINSVDDLKTFRDGVNAESGTPGGKTPEQWRTAKVTLSADLDLNGESFERIGNSIPKAFTGTFDGNHHKISNFSIDSTSAYTGLFGVVKNKGIVKKLKVHGAVNATRHTVGGIVGQLEDATIEECEFEGNISVVATSSLQKIGGLVGQAQKLANIIKCKSKVSITVPENATWVGGLTGELNKSTAINCYSTGTVTGGKDDFLGGLVGRVNKTPSISNCYTIVTKNSVALDLAKSGTVDAQNSYTTATSPTNGAVQITDENKATLHTTLGDAFKADENNSNDGYPILAWESGEATAPAQAELSLTVAPARVKYTGDMHQQTITVSSHLTNVSGSPEVTFTNKEAIREFAEIDDSNSGSLVLTPKKTGKFTVKASVESLNLIAEKEITVYPVVTTAKIQDKKGNALSAEVGEQLTAVLYTKGGVPYDEDTFGPLSYKWQIYDATTISKEEIQGGDSKQITVPAAALGKYILLTIPYEGENKTHQLNVYAAGHKNQGESTPSVPTPEKTNLEKAVEAFNSVLYPKSGTDTNILNFAKKRLTDKHIDGVNVKISNITPINAAGNANIAENGDITYFYVDPKTVPVNRIASFNVEWEISETGKTEGAKTAISKVVLFWDAPKIKEQIEREIVSKIEINETTPYGKSFELPRRVANNPWVTINWTSSDPKVISISNENQQTADTLFNPYVAIVRKSNEEKTVNLTANYVFNYTDSTGNETPISVNKVYNVKVAALNAGEENALVQKLEKVLERGLKASPLRDAITGEPLEFKNSEDTYVAKNDILFPASPNFGKDENGKGFDGKYTPISLESYDDTLIVSPKVNNAARMTVIRPAVGAHDSSTTVDMVITDKESGISAKKTFKIKVKALTKEEIDAEIALMNEVKAHYFDGIKNQNTDKENISGNLAPFVKAYKKDGNLAWARTNSELKAVKQSGIVPTPIEGWMDKEVYRLFKSSNPKSIEHETLRVHQQGKAKAVEIVSYLSSDTLGKYGELYAKDKSVYAAYEDLAPLWYQEVKSDLVVRGTETPSSQKPQAQKETISVTFTLQDAKSTLFGPVSYSGLDENITVFDIFEKALKEKGYTYRARGSYVYEIATDKGKVYTELGTGKNSGWLYSVNGEVPNLYMAAYVPSNGDAIKVYYTHDYTKDKAVQRWIKSNSISGGLEVKKEEEIKPLVTPVVLPRVAVTEESIKQVTQKFGDIKKDDWFAPAVSFVYSNNLMNGVDKDNFAADATMNRAMMVTVLYRLSGSPAVAGNGKFADVENGSYYEKAVMWANKYGIVLGYGDGKFGASDEVTREQLATILMRFSKLMNYKLDGKSELNGFSDANQIGSYSLEAMKWANAEGIISGRGDGTLAPKDNASRGEVAKMLMTFCEKAS